MELGRPHPVDLLHNPVLRLSCIAALVLAAINLSFGETKASNAPVPGATPVDFSSPLYPTRIGAKRRHLKIGAGPWSAFVVNVYFVRRRLDLRAGATAPASAAGATPGAPAPE